MMIMKHKNTHCTGQAYVRQLLKRLVYGTPMRCGPSGTADYSVPEYPIVYERETKPVIHKRDVQEVVF